MSLYYDKYWGCNYLPKSEARGALYTGPIGLSATLITSLSKIRLVFSGYSSPFIPPPSILPYPNLSIPPIHLSLSNPLLHSLLLSP